MLKLRPAGITGRDAYAVVDETRSGKRGTTVAGWVERLADGRYRPLGYRSAGPAATISEAIAELARLNAAEEAAGWPAWV